MKTIQALLANTTTAPSLKTLFPIMLPPMPSLLSETIAHYYTQILKLRSEGIDQPLKIQTCFLETNTHQPVWWRSATAENVLAYQLNETPYTDINRSRLFYAYLLAAMIIHLMLAPNEPSEYYTNAVLATEIEVKTGMLTPSEGKSRLAEALCFYHAGITSQEAIDYLDETKNWVGLLAPSALIITELQLADALERRFFIVDKPLTALTPAQKENFKQLPDQAWYQCQPPFIQKLVQFFMPMILSETRVIPSQLRSILPVLRNCYRETVYQQDLLIPLRKLNQYFHTGTAAYLGNCSRKTAITITRDNLYQEAMLSKMKQPLMICLNSTMGDFIVGNFQNYVQWMNYQYDDTKIIHYTEVAAHKNKAENPAFYAKLCLNWYRHTEWNDYTGINQLLTLMASFSENPHYKAIQQIQAAYTDNDVKSLNLIFHLSKLTQAYNQFIQTYNALMQTYLPEAQPLQTFAIWFGCASGENRTGITLYDLSLETFLEANPGFERASELLAKLQHVHVLTGNQGNTFGTEGIRKKSRLAFKTAHDQASLITPNADDKQLPHALISSAKRANLTLFSNPPLTKNSTSPHTPKPL